MGFHEFFYLQPLIISHVIMKGYTLVNGRFGKGYGRFTFFLKKYGNLDKIGFTYLQQIEYQLITILNIFLKKLNYFYHFQKYRFLSMSYIFYFLLYFTNTKI